ncbi:MAG: CDP-alcohol phosphatidyltransferase family protein [Pseudomonadota bacterium]
MPTIYQLKSRFQAILRPMVKNLALSGVTANQVTLSAIVLSALGGLYMLIAPEARLPWLLLSPLLFIRMALNAIDGMLAREYNMQSKLGAILNELGDVLSDIFLYLPFALIIGVESWIVVIICLLAVISEMTGLISIQIGANRRYDGPMGKSDRAFVFGTVGLLLGLGIISVFWLNIIFAIVVLLLLITIYNRANNALKEAEKRA